MSALAASRASPVVPDGLDRSGIDDRPIAFGFLLGYVDLAFRGIQEYESYRDIVLGPWLELDRPRGSFGVRQWTRGVEERRVLAPPLSLGTVRVRMDFRDPVRPRRRRASAEPDDDVQHRVDLRVGTPRIALFVEGPDGPRADRLFGLAREVGERFRRQLD